MLYLLYSFIKKYVRYPLKTLISLSVNSFPFSLFEKTTEASCFEGISYTACKAVSLATQPTEMNSNNLSSILPNKSSKSWTLPNLDKNSKYLSASIFIILSALKAGRTSNLYPFCFIFLNTSKSSKISFVVNK